MPGRFGKDTNGGVAIMFAIIIPLLLLGVGGALDFWRISGERERLQELADAAALAGAREFTLGAGRLDLPRKMAISAAESGFESNFPGARRDVDVKVSPADRTVHVSLQLTSEPGLVSHFIKGSTTLNAQATAVNYETANLCVLSLDPDRRERVTANESAKLSGENCSIHVNSTHASALLAEDNSLVSGVQISVSGGYRGAQANFSNQPLVDYPQKVDPLVNRSAPKTYGCDETKARFADYDGPISPGVYCGGLTISGASKVTFERGVYVIKDGPLIIEDDSEVVGEEVLFYLTGTDQRFFFLDKATVRLSGHENGAFAGLLIYQNRQGRVESNSEIRSPNVRELVGTIYLPFGDLIVDTTSEVADESAYTAIIVDELHLRNAANLVLHSDYDATDVPLPPGFEGPPVVALRE
jgi:hypothetical protein